MDFVAFILRWSIKFQLVACIFLLAAACSPQPKDAASNGFILFLFLLFFFPDYFTSSLFPLSHIFHTIYFPFLFFSYLSRLHYDSYFSVIGSVTHYSSFVISWYPQSLVLFPFSITLLYVWNYYFILILFSILDFFLISVFLSFFAVNDFSFPEPPFLLFFYSPFLVFLHRFISCMYSHYVSLFFAFSGWVFSEEISLSTCFYSVLLAMHFFSFFFLFQPTLHTVFIYFYSLSPFFRFWR